LVLEIQNYLFSFDLKALKYISIFIIGVSITINCYTQELEYSNPEYLGEDLDYTISYGFINAGVANMSFKMDTASNMFLINMTGRTVGVANAIYKILDIYDCYVDPETNLPVKAIRNVREGSYREYNEVVFDHYSWPDSTIAISQKSGLHILPKNILDILTAFYYLRTEYISKGLEVGEIVEIKTYFTDELWDFRVRYAGKETIKTQFGKIDCLKFNPVTEVGRAFKTNDDMTLWISDDKNLIPIKVVVDLRVGKFKINLEKYRGLNDEFSSLHTKK